MTKNKNAQTTDGNPRSMENRPPARTAVVHDGSGTWFCAGDLLLTFLTEEQMEDLCEGGMEWVLDDEPGEHILAVLKEAFASGSQVRWS